MFKIKTLTVKNFMSVGNATQGVNFDRQDLTLVLGENLDLGGDGSRNGTGKTTIINALSYALYGNALTNIKKDNLINKTNQKNMMVCIDFEKDGQNYRIERGRKPNVMKFFVGDTEQEITDDAQGDSRETQQAIEDILGLSHDMFKHVLALNTYTEPFLSLKANDQRTIIEQLLGITLLSEKAERLREQIKATKDLMTQEDMRIRAVQEANSRIEQQIDSLTKRQRLWAAKQQEDLDNIGAAIGELTSIDLDQEIVNHQLWDSYVKNKSDRDHLKKLFDHASKTLEREHNLLKKLYQEQDSLSKNTCYTCGQPVVNQEQQLEDKLTAIRESEKNIQVYVKEVNDLMSQLHQQPALAEPPARWYDRVEDAVAHRSNLENLQRQLASRRAEDNPYTDQIAEMSEHALQTVSYDRVNELKKLQEHEEFLLKLLTNKDSFIRKKIIDQNLSYLNSRLRYYLLKMGLPHNVTFENDLSVSISELGRMFDFDALSRGERNRLVLSLSWSFRDVWESLYHPINLLFVDEMIDNGLDTQGVEASLALLKQMSRERHKSIWLVSHRDELAGRVENILKVVKENGFTSYNTDIDIA